MFLQIKQKRKTTNIWRSSNKLNCTTFLCKLFQVACSSNYLVCFHFASEWIQWFSYRSRWASYSDGFFFLRKFKRILIFKRDWSISTNFTGILIYLQSSHTHLRCLLRALNSEQKWVTFTLWLLYLWNQINASHDCWIKI